MLDILTFEVKTTPGLDRWSRPSFIFNCLKNPLKGSTMLSKANKSPLSRTNKAGRKVGPLKKWAYFACPAVHTA
jgi:hypothetical protein